jgi:hypothetical protein
MLLRVVRYLAAITTFAPLIAAGAHLYELPNKLALDGPLWLAVQQNLYRGWGPVFGPFEIIAAAAAWVLLYLVRTRRSVALPTLIAALALSAMIAVFFVFNAPVNAALAGWTAQSLPPDWPAYRLQWEIGHALAFLLGVAAFGLQLRAAFVDVARI